MWNDEGVSDFFFGSDRVFQEKFCSTRMKENIKNNGLSGKISDLRSILIRLTEINPNLEYTCPGWSIPAVNQLLVCAGKARLSINRRSDKKEAKINRPRFGLCVIDGSIHFWTDVERVSNVDDWISWGANDSKYYFKKALTIDSLQGESDLVRIVRSTMQSGRFDPEEIYRYTNNKRQSLGGGFHVLSPRLVEICFQE